MNKEDYKGIWVFAEQRDGMVATVAYELLGEGRKLADELETELCAVLFGSSEEQAQELIRWGADRVLHCTHPLLERFHDEPYSQLLARLIGEHKPEIVLSGATPIGRSFMPRVAVRLRTGLAADCTSLVMEKETRTLLQVKPAYGGNIMATIVCPEHRPQMTTVRPGILKKGVYDPERKGEIIAVPAGDLSSRTLVLETVKETQECAVKIQDAPVVIAGGRGMGDEKGFRLLDDLAALLGGVVGATRPPVDEGWINHNHQIGQTGKAVCPRIYFACGISGAVQHTVGVQPGDMVIVINKNPEAPIFDMATHGIVGDVN
ncbi:MAG: electron transfer flavoprotein subunit alpha/FixB family protein, partial [Nitrospirales bacterium]|nr:electron transfer flavoprotein subunit alpha/FixB family protein [Nitrospirales bacterium]